jgi:hypothetical protein
MKMKLILSGAFLLVASAARLSAQPTLRANPNPVILPAGQTQSTTTVTWNTGSEGGYIWLSVDGGEETQLTKAGAAAGTLGATGEIGKSYVFKLYTADRQQLLASVTVTVSGQPAAAQPPVVARPGRVRQGRSTGKSAAVVTVDPAPATSIVKAGKAGAERDKAYENLKDPNAAQVVDAGNDSRRAAFILANRRFISNVRLKPDTRDVIISFSSTQNSPSLIEIGKVAPTPDSHGTMSFPANSGAFSRFITGQNGNYSLNVGALNERLDIGTTYYYIINVFNDDRNNTTRPREQVTGTFTTVGQTVKVIFTEISLVPDMLRIGQSYRFEFDVNVPDGLELSRMHRDWIIGHFGQPDNWQVPGRSDLGNAALPVRLVSGPNPIQQEILIENAPDVVRMEVRGGVPNLSGNAGAQFNNVAKGSFDLSAYRLGPGDRISLPFTLTTGSRASDSILDGHMRFNIKGRIEVTRH